MQVATVITEQQVAQSCSNSVFSGYGDFLIDKYADKSTWNDVVHIPTNASIYQYHSYVVGCSRVMFSASFVFSFLDVWHGLGFPYIG